MWWSCEINKLLKSYKIMNILKKFWRSIATRFIPQKLAVSLRNINGDYIYFITDTIFGTYPEDFYFIIAKGNDDVVKYFEKFNDNNLKIEFNPEIGRLHRKNNICEEYYYVIGKISINELKHRTGESMHDVCYELFDEKVIISRN